MKKLMSLLVLAVATISVNATSPKAIAPQPECNWVIVYPCPGNPITTGCFDTYEKAAEYLALNPTVNCPPAP